MSDSENPKPPLVARASSPEVDTPKRPEVLPQEFAREIAISLKHEMKHEIQIGLFDGPSIEYMQKLQSLVPDAANRLLIGIEEERRHKHQIDKEMVAERKRGQIFAFIIALVFFIGAFLLIAIGKSGEGIAAVITAIVAAAGLFYYKTKSEAQSSDSE